MSLGIKQAKRNRFNLTINTGETNKVKENDIENYNAEAKDGKGDDEDRGAEKHFPSSSKKETMNTGGKSRRKSKRRLRIKTNRKRRKSKRKSRRKHRKRTRTGKKGGGLKARNNTALQNALTKINNTCNISLIHMGPVSFIDAGMYNANDFSLTTKGAQIIEYANGLSSNRHGCEAVKEALSKDPFNFR